MKILVNLINVSKHVRMINDEFIKEFNPDIGCPIIVIEAPNDRYDLIDGYHRVMASKELGIREILAVVLSEDDGLE